MGGKPRRRAAGWRLPATMVVAWTATFGVAVTCADLAVANPALPPAASELIETANASLAAGDPDAAAAALRRLRLHYPDSPLAAEALLLSATVAAARNNAYQERFFLAETRRAVRRLVDNGLLSGTVANDYHLQTTSRLAELLEAERDYAGALRNYEEAIALLAARLDASPVDSATAPSLARRLARLRLAAARLAYRRGVGVGGDAARHFDQVDLADLDAGAVPMYRELARGLMWEHLTPRHLGVGDGNISAIATDGDDAWVGTWTGGLVRHTRSTGRRQVFREGPESLHSRRVRVIHPVGGYVWVGTDEGLSVYSLSSSRWRQEPVLGRGEPSPVVAVADAGGAVYAGTLGQGLWRHDASGWSRVGHESLPGLFINTLLVVDRTLWIGTIDLGLVSLDLRSGTLRSFDEVSPALGPQNVTAILAEDDATLWIGTFGAGLYRWEADTNRVTHFSAATGQIPDDWILAAAAGDAGLYFGTFGGGAVRYDPLRETWTTISLEQGLTSLNVAVVAAARGRVYFGTLGAGVAILSEARSVHGLQEAAGLRTDLVRKWRPYHGVTVVTGRRRSWGGDVGCIAAAS